MKTLFYLSTTKLKPTRDQLEPVHYGDSNSIDTIDGSKGWHIFRDKGQFGSHPIFDLMDNESTP